MDIPPYAVLSHTWGKDSEEVSYHDVLNGRLDSATTRPTKVTGCCKEAKADGYQYVWIDTCCIDKTNSVELNEAINSMFRWYREAAICYAYLSDFSHMGGNGFSIDFSSSRWFQRGWTLQELLAPLNLRFYDTNWECVGNKGDLCDTVEAITGIPTPFLLGMTELQHASVAQRMSWAAKRVTTRPEDIAYCLLGIFNVYMPLIYGEGNKAFRRLQEQIMKDIDDDSILAWDFNPGKLPREAAPDDVFGGALAPAPSFFANSGQVIPMDRHAHLPIEVHSISLHLAVSLYTTPTGQTLGLLKCGIEGDKERLVGIPLSPAPRGQPNTYFRLEGHQAVLTANSGAPASIIRIQVDGLRKSSSQVACWFHVRKSIRNLELIDVHPNPCWHKERALIEAVAEPTDEGVQRILARFRQSTEPSADFVVVLEIDSDAKPRCSLMIASRNTSLGEIASNAEVWRGMATERECAANNGSLNLAMELETIQASSSQRIFILKPVALQNKPPVTISATTALQLSGATEMLDDLLQASEENRAKAQGLRNDMTDVIQTVAEAKAGLDKIRAEIEALKLEELRAIEKYDRARKQEAELLGKYNRVKKVVVSIWERISGMERFLDIYNSGEEGSEKEDALSKAAAQVLPFAILDEYDHFAGLLIDQASDVTTKDHEGFTPLDHAVLRGQGELARMLIDKGADVSSPGAEGVTPLHNAAERGFIHIVRLLLEKGADVSPPDAQGVTPLHIAAARGLIDIARLLVDKGASLTATNRDGMTPLDVALSEGQDKLFALLTPRKTTKDAGPPPQSRAKLWTPANLGMIEWVTVDKRQRNQTDTRSAIHPKVRQWSRSPMH